MKLLPGSPSLSAQLILSFIAVVVLTAIALMIPTIWLIRSQLDRAAWSQIEQGARSAQALYLAREREVNNIASLTSQRPTLHALLAQRNAGALENYLTTLQAGVDLDLIAVCDESLTLFVSTMPLPRVVICDAMRSGGIIHNEDGAGAWITASKLIESTNIQETHVVVGLQMDDAFASEIRQQTGLEHTIWIEGRPAATSFSPGLPALGDTVYQPISPQNPALENAFRFSLADQPYYATRFSPGNDVGIQAEVALDTATIVAAQARTIWISGLSILGVALIVSILGVYLARQFSRPLERLSTAARDFSVGDLESPLLVDARVREITQVAQVLESARVDLLETMSNLRHEKEWGEHLLASIVEGIVTLDQSNQIIFFSHGAERITGWTRDEVIGQSCDQIFQLSEMDTPFSRAIPGPGQRLKLDVMMAEGREATLAITSAKLAPSDVQDAQVALVFRDVSDEEAVRRLMGHFLANVAHEFRTPLSALAASIELLMDQAHTLSYTELRELLISLHLGILNLRTLVDNLLESASIEAGRFRISPRQSDLGEIIAQAAQTMQPLLEKYGQQLIVELPADIPVVNADPRRMVQVLVNLLSNASKYGLSDANVVIRASRDDAWVRVEVIDQGPGISLDHRDEIFHRFVHANLADNSTKMGAGLGLSVVKAIIEAHGGQVGVEDRPGGGSIFWYTLPLASD